MRSFRLVGCCLLLLLLASCGGDGGFSSADGDEASSGSIAFRMSAPAQQTTAQIASAQVEVLNPSTRTLLLPAQSLTFGQEAVFSPVPVGTQLVRAMGFDSSGNVVASAEVLVEVHPGQVSRASLVLTPSTTPPDPPPAPSPTPPPNDNPPTQLAFTVNPPATFSGNFSVTVEIRDADGNRVTTANNAISLSLVSPGSATLGGTTTLNAVNGQAVFTGLSVSEPGTFTLQATSTGLSSATSSSFDVTVNVALYAVMAPAGTSEPNAKLVELDPETGEFIGSFGKIDSPGITNGLAVQGMIYLPDGTIYVNGRDQFNNQDSFLVRVDPADPGNSAVMGMMASNSPDGDFIHSMAYDPNTQTAYALLNDRSVNRLHLGTVNLTNGVFTPLPNDTGVSRVGGGRGLAFDAANSTLYMTSPPGLANSDLYTIDTTTGVATLIGIVNNFGDQAVKALAVNPVDNQLYGITRNGVGAGVYSGYFGTINTSTAVATVLEDTVVNCTGLCFVANPTLPPAPPVHGTTYTVTTIPANFTDVTGGTNLPAVSTPSTIPLPFTFNFDGTDFSSLRIFRSGYASFTPTFGGNFPILDVLPTLDTHFLDNSLLVWTDWYTTAASAGASLHYDTVGSAPNRRFIVQWIVDQDLVSLRTGNTISFELVLYEGTNVIEYHYADVDGGSPSINNGSSGVVGLSVNETTAYMFSIFQPVLTTTEGIRFTP